uniref:Uncharacterized protein LOC111101001 isoform X2 n=1 Tax=Crassostrea virginica TaxID=6565 RepID=A0A8B8AG14_CRAVI|nr:uncharacterized protein LOC111101001 isoform X2 [Crassostrea virginica]
MLPEKEIGYLQNIDLVHTCPEDQKDVIKASQQLGCQDDSFGNNQYMCLPNEEKTSLVQFCYDGIMGIQEKGNCLVANVSNGTVLAQSCRDFLYGCPSNHFWNHEVYQYYACQNINVHDHCYKASPFCPPNKNTMEGEDHSFRTTVIVLLSLVVLCGVFGVVWLICKQLRRSRGSHHQQARFNGETSSFDSTTDDSTFFDTIPI